MFTVFFSKLTRGCHGGSCGKLRSRKDKGKQIRSVEDLYRKKMQLCNILTTSSKECSSEK